MSSSNKSPSQDHTVEFFQSLADAKRVTIPRKPLKPSYPRVVGLALGALLGLIYGLTSQIINHFLVPGVPFAQYPCGSVGNGLINIVSGAVIGLACALPQSAVNGVCLGTIVTAGVAILQWLAAHAASATALLPPDTITPWAPFQIGFYLLLFAPLMLILRLAIDDQVEFAYKPVWAWARLRLSLLLVVIISVIGGFSIFPTHVQRALLDMHALIQKGLSTSDAASLPSDLVKEQGVTGFLNYATTDYTLEQSSDSQIRGALGIPVQVYGLIIVARFKNNWILACAYDENGERFRCTSYETPDLFQKTGFVSDLAP